MNADKRVIRETLREQRRRLPDLEVGAAGAAVLRQLRALRAYQCARVVLAYLADENEVPTAPLIESLIASACTVYLPCSEPEVGFVRWSADAPLVRGRGGVLQPAEGVVEFPPEPSLALLPMVGWDSDGTRLGRGGGFYDRVLGPSHGRIVKIGLAYEFQHVRGLPRDPWDVPVDYVITEQRIVCCGDRPSMSPPLFGIQKGGSILE